MATTLFKPPVGQRLNHGHPLAYGLKHAYLLNAPGSRTARCSITNLEATLQSNGVWAAGQDGPVYDAAGSNGAAVNSTSPYAFDDASLSLVIVSQATAGNNGSRRYTVRLASATNAVAVVLGWGGSSTGVLTATTLGTVSMTATMGINVWTVGVLVCEAINSRKLYANGRLASTQTTTATVDTNLDRIAITGDSTGFNWLQTSAVLIYNRPLIQAEAQALSADPYAMFRPATEQRRYLSSVAPPPTMAPPPFRRPYRFFTRRVA